MGWGGGSRAAVLPQVDAQTPQALRCGADHAQRVRSSPPPTRQKGHKRLPAQRRARAYAAGRRRAKPLGMQTSFAPMIFFDGFLPADATLPETAQRYKRHALVIMPVGRYPPRISPSRGNATRLTPQWGFGRGSGGCRDLHRRTRHVDCQCDRRGPLTVPARDARHARHRVSQEAPASWRRPQVGCPGRFRL